MQKTEYHIQMPLPGGADYYTLCVAITPEGAAEAVRALLAADTRVVSEIRLLVVRS